MVDIAEKTEQIDKEETPQSRQRKKVAKEAAARKASAKVVEDSWYEINNGKLSKVTISGTGNTHRVYQCNADKKHKDFIEGLKKKGLIRA